jgi:molybdenum cofactor guanylyltransferase
MRLGGAILAGGEGRRMGGTDKPSLILGDRRLIDHVAARLRPQVEILAISANGDTSRFADLGLDVRADDPDRRAGPLAGLATMLDHFAAGHPGISHLLTAPADAPFLPDDLAERLADALSSLVGAMLSPETGIYPLILVMLLTMLAAVAASAYVRHVDRLVARQAASQLDREDSAQ